ncbi:MAG: hypothetical protein ACREUG_15745, partial [Steroidobacteraceae bacterium]
YEAGKSIFSAYCGSAYQTEDKSLLVDYAVASGATEALLLGLGRDHRPVFEFRYPTTGCDTSWNARPVPLDDMQIER